MIMEQVQRDVENFLQHECSCANMQTLNNNLTDQNNLIMYVNIRSINAYLKNLEIIIESLYVKPCVIVVQKLGNWKTINNINYLITKFCIVIVELIKTTGLLYT